MLLLQFTTSLTWFFFKRYTFESGGSYHEPWLSASDFKEPAVIDNNWRINIREREEERKRCLH